MEATTYVGKNIDKNTTWNKKNSPYIITFDLIVKKDVLLKIEAGTEIFFSKETHLIVDGAIIAIGEKSKKIKFKGFHHLSWNGIILTKRCAKDDNKSIFEYCLFEGNNAKPQKMICAQSCDLIIKNCHFKACHTAIDIVKHSNIIIQKNKFDNCFRVLHSSNTSFVDFTNNKCNHCNSLLIGGSCNLTTNNFKNFGKEGRNSGITIFQKTAGKITIKGNTFSRFSSHSINIKYINTKTKLIVVENTFYKNSINLTLNHKVYNTENIDISKNTFHNGLIYDISIINYDKKNTAKINLSNNIWKKGYDTKNIEITDSKNDKIEALPSLFDNIQ